MSTPTTRRRSPAPEQETSMTQETAIRSTAQAAPTGGAVGLRVSGVDKVYPTRRGEVRALSGIDLEVARGEFVSLVGRSGCGKTTLLRILSGLLAPSAGLVEAGARPAWAAGRRDDAVFAEFGLVFQEAYSGSVR
ncbi:ATP-binding cassette domain-containing protein [Pseudonocardia sp. ICBG601]|uniref:ATP-binding cassette domain-containing protein n=1 Tax=Pseudonocardia sp. ICBG601 TaxID=2846759 RepID=UPI001CF65DB1|nr:ATP-binding cassette domain-containing protein [Pseudonocardia sp. ICBG601]